MKIAIAFGGGKESVELVKKLTSHNPLLICCLGKEDTVHRDVIRGYADNKGLSIILSIFTMTPLSRQPDTLSPP